MVGPLMFHIEILNWPDYYKTHLAVMSRRVWLLIYHQHRWVTKKLCLLSDMQIEQNELRISQKSMKIQKTHYLDNMLNKYSCWKTSCTRLKNSMKYHRINSWFSSNKMLFTNQWIVVRAKEVIDRLHKRVKEVTCHLHKPLQKHQEQAGKIKREDLKKEALTL